jgi:hypothetical protein
MSETTQTPSSSGPSNNGDSERTKQVSIAGWTAGTVGFFAVCALWTHPSWELAVGVVAIAVMVAVVCYFILKRP